MEFKDKLQKLRKENNLTQEELASSLFVTRMAISKWETGRGYPNIDSLQAISKLFNISINDLLSCEELVNVTKSEKRETSYFYTFLIFFFVDILVLAFIFLPLYANAKDNNGIIMVNLFKFECSNSLKIIYSIWFSVKFLIGLMEAIFCFKKTNKAKQFLIISIIYEISLVSILILSRQPYPGILALFYLSIKICSVLYLLKKHGTISI